MGEARRRRALEVGTIHIEANHREFFNWTGTQSDAIELQKQYLAAANVTGADTRLSVRTALVHGMPEPGTPDHRADSPLGSVFDRNEVVLYKAAILWLVLREHILDTGLKVEDVFVGKELIALFEGNPQAIAEHTRRETLGLPQEEYAFAMKVGMLDE